jgi:hypothetical protein
VAEVIRAAEPDRGEPAEALRRVVAETWGTLARYRPLVAVNMDELGHEALHQRHTAVFDELRPLIERGQASGAFNGAVPAGWHLSMLVALVHAASAEVRAGRAREADAGPALVDAVLGAISA